jgi:polyisoprenoid-binding protein YceI
MKLNGRFLLAAAVAAVLAAPAIAAPEKFEIDPTHSQAGFTVRHFFSKVPGRFNDMSGWIQYDAKNLASSSVEVTIPAASINTENERRDKHLRSADFFNVEKDSMITFKSTKVIPGTGDRFKIEGDLTIRGVTKSVTIDATQLGMGEVGIGGNAIGVRAGWEGTLVINRKDYGVSWNKTLDQGGTMLSDDVTILLSVEALKPAPKPDAAKADAPKPAGK